MLLELYYNQKHHKGYHIIRVRTCNGISGGRSSDSTGNSIVKHAKTAHPSLGQTSFEADFLDKGEGANDELWLYCLSMVSARSFQSQYEYVLSFCVPLFFGENRPGNSAQGAYCLIL